MKRISSVLIPFFLLTFAFAKELPNEYYILRDDMYNFVKPPEELELDFKAYVEKSKQTLSGYELNLTLARYEYIIGRSYSYDGQKEKASEHFDKGTGYAENALKEKESAQSQLIYAENISANCAVKPVSWVISWGSKIKGLTKKVLKLDEKNGAALYMQNAQDVYAPKPFNNFKRGIREMSALLDNPNVILDKDDEFNVKSAIGYAHIKLGDSVEAKAWLEKSLEIYPGNKFVQGLLQGQNAEDISN